MKRFYRFVALFTSLFLVLSVNTFAYNPTTLKYDRFLSSIFFLQDPHNPSQVELDMMNCIENTTPYDLMELFRQEGVRIYITKGISQSERTLSGSGYDGITYSAAFSWNGQNKITKVSEKVAVYVYDNCNDVTVYYHEFGHVLDDLAEYISGYYKGQDPLSSSSEWQTIYANNSATMAAFDRAASINVPLSTSEGFAEAFRLYFVYPEKLKTSCPDVYNYVSSQITKYTSYLKPITYDNFDAFMYYVNNPDVAAAVGVDKKALWNHYKEHGKAEGRTAYRISN